MIEKVWSGTKPQTNKQTSSPHPPQDPPPLKELQNWFPEMDRKFWNKSNYSASMIKSTL